ncbi:MAG: hypothetical protein KBS59_01640 [Clostridiales bacterium]|nr:hypothetical protein [Clostridiales bacterium]
MEISRKSMSTEQIIAKEKEIIAKIGEIKDEYAPKFEALGYELCDEYLQRNDLDREYSEITDDADNYVNGYASRAGISVKKILSESEKEADDVPAPEDESEEDRIARKALEAQKELERTAAYTELLIVRLYKVFWSEKLSVCDSFDTLKADLDEFLASLSKEK